MPDVPGGVFVWLVSNQTTLDDEVLTDEVEFEGYRQIGERFNAIKDTITVDVGPIEMTEAQACFDFLRLQKGQPFKWTPLKPLAQVERLWTCKNFGFKRVGGLIVGIRATFINFNAPP